MLQLEDATREGAWRAPQGRTQVRRRIARQVRVRRQSSGPPTNHRPPSSIAACRRCRLRTLSRTRPWPSHAACCRCLLRDPRVLLASSCPQQERRRIRGRGALQRHPRRRLHVRGAHGREHRRPSLQQGAAAGSKGPSWWLVGPRLWGPPRAQETASDGLRLLYGASAKMPSSPRLAFRPHSVVASAASAPRRPEAARAARTRGRCWCWATRPASSRSPRRTRSCVDVSCTPPTAATSAHAPRWQKSAGALAAGPIWRSS